MSLLLCLSVFGSLAGVKDELPQLSAPGTSASQSDAEVFGDKNVGEMSVDGETSRKDLCLMAEILCGEQISKETEKMSDEQLRQFVEEKLEAAGNNGANGGNDNSVASPVSPSSDSSVTPAPAASENENSSASSDKAAKPLGLDADVDENGEEAEEPSVNPEEHKDDYTEDGELKRPFDEVYPELMDTEVVEYDDETVLVKMGADFDGKVTAEMKKAGVAALEQLFPTKDAVWYEAFLVKGTEVDKAVEALRENKDILLVDYNYEVKTAAMDDYEEVDKKLHGNKNITEQWYMNYCGIPKGQKELANPGGSPSVVVAVIDTGVDYTHEDLSDNIWVNSDEIPGNDRDDDGNGYVDDYYGVNLVAGKGNAADDNGHGTHVAGIIAAENNNLGTVGIAYNTKIMPIKAAMASGILNQATIAKAIYYAYENGAEVINMSFGGPTCSIAVQDALAVAYTRCVLVASAGNDASINEGLFALPNYPAALSYVLGVMSVGRKGAESGFTNFDGVAYTNAEYELYAPGEEILSTIPGDRYAKWSGTSMAAPVVSAFAALLRSEYADRDTYPTKFIYGQLSATSENQASCIHPVAHNVPYITNLYSAVTKMPKPDVGLSDYYVFDSKGFEADETQVNNGDGVIDSGETVALGFVLRNRWGMSKNTVVTVDSLSQAGIPDPYIEYINPSVDYGSIGTYSTGDCGKIYDDELFSAWENPFYIRISEDCPNDYIFRVNIHIRCENALDEDDNTVYSGDYSVLLKVRSGCILPSVIKEDMTLTPENLYIIPNATTILEGVTVKVEPGTHIQFWSDDANDPYADKYIAYLRVEGQFLVEGTAENPVYLYPSELMSNYNVDIGQVNNGYVSLTHADLTNFMEGSVSLAENCTFRINTPGYVYRRYVSGGSVHSSSCDRIGTIGKAENCMFYKISTRIYGSFNRCAFVDCGLDYSYSSDNRFTNCVFYGNYFQSQSNTLNYYAGSSYTATDPGVSLSASDVQIVYRPETGTSYALIYEKGSGYHSAYKAYYDSLGWRYAVLETEDELQWLQKAGLKNSYVYVGATRKNGKTVWSDGTPVGDFIDTPSDYAPSIDIFYSKFANYSTYYSLLEFPGEIYVSDIAFDEYHVRIDTGSTYRIRPITQPVPFEAKDLIFESADESVAVVDETGLVTPVKKGRTDIYVSSRDRAVKNHVTVNVMDYVPLEGLSFEKDFCKIEVGESLALSCVLSPENTTRRNVTFSSSNPETVSVSESGVITANARGEAVITASCEGLTAEIRVQGVKKAEKLEITEPEKVYFLNQEKASLPEVNFGDADVKLSWKSSDNNVAQVADGELLLKSSGRVVLRVTDEISGLYDNITVYVTDDEELTGISKIIYNGGNNQYILREDGNFYQFGEKTALFENIKNFDAGYYGYNTQYATCYCFLFEDGKIKYGSSLSNLSTIDSLEDITKVFAMSDGTYYAISSDGVCYAWGRNTENCAGTGNTGIISEPTKVTIENVVDVATVSYSDYATYFLTTDGYLYMAGTSNKYSVPQLISDSVEKIAGYDYPPHYALVGEKWCLLSTNGFNNRVEYPYAENDLPGYSIENGRAYSVDANGSKTLLSSKITNVKNIFRNYDTTYILTEDNVVYGYGQNREGSFLGGITISEFSNISSQNAIIVPTFNYDSNTLRIEGANVMDGVLEENELKIDFNGILGNYGCSLYADGKQIFCATSYDFDTMTVSLSKGFSRGVSYRLVISPSNVSCWYLGRMAEEYTLDFTFGEPVPDEPEEETTEPVTGEPEEETTEAVTGEPEEETTEAVTEETSQEGTEPVTEEAAQETTEAVTEEPETEPEAEEEPEEPEDVHEAVTDESVERYYLTVDEMVETMNDAIKSFNPYFYNNVILNRLSTEFDVNRWLRVLAPESSSYREVSFGRNYWGTTNEKAIALQTIDYTDFQTYAKLNCEPYLTEAPEDTFPFVTDVAIFDSNGTRVTTVGNEKITVRVSFNRDMDESIPLLVRFGSAYPYGDYEISGAYVDARTWEGTTTLSTIIENGNQYFTISDGKAKGTDLALMTDRYRFTFVIDTTAAQALIMQGNAADEGIELSWYQDDFDTLIGYNVYRSTSEDGYYQRLNSVVIPADTKTYFDDTVEPGVKYYYNFTVVKSDLTESSPSGKIVIMSKDTMAPNIYHTPVYTACMGSNLLINATVTDNLAVNTVKVYYRTVGTDEWKISFMNKLNDKYSALISAEDLSLDGFEYYIEAFDGVSSTYKGSAENPYRVTVQQPLDADSLGDVNGDGKITNLDALMLLQAINDLINLDSEQFARADLNADGVLTAAEALRILQYVSGAVGTVKM